MIPPPPEEDGLLVAMAGRGSTPPGLFSRMLDEEFAETTQARYTTRIAYHLMSSNSTDFVSLSMPGYFHRTCL